MEIPKGNTREEIKIRERLIKDFYAVWIANNPSKSVWNKSLMANIKVKQLSYNETHEHQLDYIVINDGSQKFFQMRKKYTPVTKNKMTKTKKHFRLL